MTRYQIELKDLAPQYLIVEALTEAGARAIVEDRITETGNPYDDAEDMSMTESEWEISGAQKLD